MTASGFRLSAKNLGYLAMSLDFCTHRLLFFSSA